MDDQVSNSCKGIKIIQKKVNLILNLRLLESGIVHKIKRGFIEDGISK